MRQPSSWILNFSSPSPVEFLPYWKNNFEFLLKQNYHPSKQKKSFDSRIQIKYCPIPLIVTNLENIFNINFIRKEKTYTKLKYSRTPAYDIISGGVAVIFAGFLAFLISEKFGLELGDSADFFFVVIYLILFLFPIRMLMKLDFDKESTVAFLTGKSLIKFFYIIFNLISLFIRKSK